LVSNLASKSGEVVGDSVAADKIEKLGFDVLVDLFDWYSQLHDGQLGKAPYRDEPWGVWAVG
jgi:hypothetical protein